MANVCVCVCVCVHLARCVLSHGLLHPWDFPGKNTGVGCHFLLQGTFPTQGSNLHLLHCSQILYHLATGEARPKCELLANAPTIYRDWFFQNLLGNGKVCAFQHSPLLPMIV